MNQRRVAAFDRLVLCEGVSAREFDGEWVVLDLTEGNYFGLDELGGLIWRRLSEGQTPSEVAAEIARSYEVTEATALQDALRLVDELLSRGLVRIAAVKD